MSPPRAGSVGPRRDATTTTQLDTPAYRLSGAEVADRLDSPDGGLATEEAQQRLERFGRNELEDRGGKTPFQIVLDQFREILIWVLLAAAAISGLVLGEWIESVAILAIVVLSAAMGFVQEYRAEEAMAALQAMAAPVVRVRRDGRERNVPATELVPGDRLLLETGNVVPADARLVSSAALRVEEAALTGESEPVDKTADVVHDTELAIADRSNLVHMGTIVAIGRAEAVVIGTGMDTELGHIAGLLQGVEDDQTPLQRRLDDLGKVLAVAAGLIVVVIAGLGLARGEDLDTILLTSVSLAVAAIPEAMPAVVTIALSLGAQRMLARNALIRSLPAVETLGSVDVICSDKTGTLTLNRMTMVVLDVAEHRLEVGEHGPIRDGAKRSTIDLALVTGLMCNDAQPTDDGSAEGEPTEAALVVAATKAGFDKPALEAILPRIDEVPFESARKRMTTIHRWSRDDGVPDALAELDRVLAEVGSPPLIGFTKGAVSSLLPIADRVWVEGGIAPLDHAWRDRIEASEASLAAEGMRVLGLAVRGHPAPPDPHQAESGVVFVGLVGLIDPARSEVPDAVARCRSAGIRPVMITGDHPLTAAAIATDVGIATSGTEAVTGLELDGFDDETLADVAETSPVFARVSPEHKLRLVDALQSRDHLVAMTGDGVNDAPALKTAHIGVAMGITGTDVTKQAGDMVLLDDNFATIVAAVEEGRVIYDNIRKFIRYLLTCNASELAVMILGPLFGMPLPLLPLQILWMNLVTDGLPALALGVESAEEDVMDRPPRSANESVFGGGTAAFIGIFGTLMSIVALAVGFGLWSAGEDHWQSVLFTGLIFAQLGLALEIRSDKAPVWHDFWGNRAMLGAVAVGLAAHVAIIYVPFLQRVFGTAPLSLGEWGMALAGTLVVMAGVELWKWRLRAAERVS